MKELESALSLINKEINYYSEILKNLNSKLTELTVMAHDLAVDYANNVFTEEATSIGNKSEAVGEAIAKLEREINVIETKMNALYKSKANVNGFISEYSKEETPKAK